MYKDERGEIEDLIVTDEHSVTRITFNKDAVRGNHLHKETTQIDIVLSGSLVCGQDGATVVINKGQAVTHAPNVKHAYKALEKSEILSLCFGKRRGEHYEEDTFRLSNDEKLL